jgi:hypothetical protein
MNLKIGDYVGCNVQFTDGERFHNVVVTKLFSDGSSFLGSPDRRSVGYICEKSDIIDVYYSLLENTP